MIRTIFFAAILVSTVSAKAQTPLTFGSLNGDQPRYSHFNRSADSNHVGKKWFVQKYASLSTGFMAFKGGSGTFVSAPVGLQLYRQLSNNVYGFVGASIAPTYFNMNGAFFQPGAAKNNGFMNASNFGVQSMAQMGLMYINNDRTFSISGSIGVGRNLYNGYSPFYGPYGAQQAAPGFRNNQFSPMR